MNRGPLYFTSPKSYGGELRDFTFSQLKLVMKKIKQINKKSNIFCIFKMNYKTVGLSVVLVFIVVAIIAYVFKRQDYS